MDPLTQQPTGLPTSGDPNAAALLSAQQQQQQGSAFVPPVNPAQAQLSQQSVSLPSPQQQQQQQTTQQTLPSAERDLYESRIRNLMSQKDQAINERNLAVQQLTQLQADYTREKGELQQSLSNTTTATQTVMGQSKQYEAEIASLRGQLARANVLLEKPHLAGYAAFLPATADADQMKAVVDSFEAARAQDIARQQTSLAQGGYTPASVALPGQLPFGQGFPGQTTTSTPTTMPPSSLANLPGQVGATNPLALAGQQQAFSGIGSNPSQMNPAAGMNHNDRIAQLMKGAMASGDPVRFEQALAEAKAMVPSAIQAEFGR